LSSNNFQILTSVKVRQAPGERCYHIFYQIMSGFDSGLRAKLQLTNELSYYHFQSQGELTIEGVDDKEEMKLTQEAFDIMGFEDLEVRNAILLVIYVIF